MSIYHTLDVLRALRVLLSSLRVVKGKNKRLPEDNIGNQRRHKKLL